MRQPVFVQSFPVTNQRAIPTPLSRNNIPPIVMLNPGQIQQSVSLPGTSFIQPAKQLPSNYHAVQCSSGQTGLSHPYQTGNVAAQNQLQQQFQAGLRQTGLPNPNPMTVTLLPESVNQVLLPKRPLMIQPVQKSGLGQSSSTNLNPVSVTQIPGIAYNRASVEEAVQKSGLSQSGLTNLHHGVCQRSAAEQTRTTASGPSSTSMPSRSVLKEDNLVKDEGGVTTSMFEVDETPLKDEQDLTDLSASCSTSQMLNQFSSSNQNQSTQNPGPSNLPDVDDVDDLLGEISSLVDILAQQVGVMRYLLNKQAIFVVYFSQRQASSQATILSKISKIVKN